MADFQPVFLLSLPRAGSTLVQRLLAGHPEIATTTEPWLLLPFLYALRGRGVLAEYDHVVLHEAVEDFIGRLPGGEQEYLDAVRRLALELYRGAAGEGARFFLDKTPRYHLVAPDLFRTFEDGRFIFLWRNPLAVVASTVESWADGRWSVHRWRVDLFEGAANLVAASMAHAEQSCSIRFEDVISDPEAALRPVFAYLGLQVDAGMLRMDQGPSLHGRLGDQRGTAAYGSISTEPLSKWKSTLANPVRKGWCRRYLRWLGRERLAVMGYDMGALLAELEAIPSTPRRVGSDLARLARGAAVRGLRRAVAPLD